MIFEKNLLEYLLCLHFLFSALRKRGNHGFFYLKCFYDLLGRDDSSVSVSRAELLQFNYHQASNKVSDTKALFQFTTFLLHFLSEGQRRKVVCVLKTTFCLRFITNSEDIAWRTSPETSIVHKARNRFHIYLGLV